MSDAADGSDPGVVERPGAGGSGQAVGFFSGLFQGGMLDGQARRHAQLASPIETEFYGVFFENAALGVQNFGLTPPLVGDSVLLEMFVWPGANASAASAHVLGLAYGRVVPVNVAAFNALDQVFPNASNTSVARNEIRFHSAFGGVVVRGRFALRPRGRSLVVHLLNLTVTTNDVYVGLVIEARH